ncbi:MAG: hypothetical protein EOO63_08380 [Hymenobacter sp.]|nr:MAG: hypothetical protein EOO63_08380 [Hymenobacter sp.]
MTHRLCLGLLLLATSCSFHTPTRQEQAIMDFMRHHDPKQGYFGPVPSTYEPVSFSAPRKCRFWELLGDHAQQNDTAVVGVAIEHVYRLQGDSGKMEEYTEDFIVSANGRAGFIDH